MQRLSLRRVLWLVFLGTPIRWARLARRWVFSVREYNVLEHDFDEPRFAAPLRAGEEVRVFTEPSEALREFLRVRYGSWREDLASAIPTMERRFSRGELCFAFMDHDRMTTNLWSSERSLFEPELQRARPLQAGEIVLYDIFTLPEFRGRRQYDPVFARFAEWFRARGKTRVVLVVDSGNTPSLKANFRAGVRRVGFRARRRRLFGRGQLTLLPAPVPLATLLPPKSPGHPNPIETTP